jgi:hypothetical protein
LQCFPGNDEAPDAYALAQAGADGMGRDDKNLLDPCNKSSAPAVPVVEATLWPPSSLTRPESQHWGDFMKALERDEGLNVVLMAAPRPANDAEPILQQGKKKWHRVTINRKTFTFALVAEFVMIGAILVVNWSLAERGDTGEAVLFGKSAFWLAAIAGALAMASCELVRAGLVFLGAVHRRRAVRGLMLLGALLSILVTTKSMSVVYEQLFASRLREVVAATIALNEALANKATLEAKRNAPVHDDDDRKARLARLDAELGGLRTTLTQFGTPPKPVTKLVSTYDRYGQITGQRSVTTTPPWSGATMQSQYVKAQAERENLSAELARSQAGLRNIEFQIAQANEAVTAAKSRRMEKIVASQMHSYAAMIFFKSPEEVTEKEVHIVLLVFVMLAAFATAVTASLAVYGSFTRFPPNDEPRPGDGSPNAVVITPTLQNWVERVAARGTPVPSARGA